MSQRTKILEFLLENRDVSRVKRVPCSVSINFAPELRKHVGNCFKQRKGDFACTYVTEFATFALPQGKLVETTLGFMKPGSDNNLFFFCFLEIDELHPSAQQRLFDELLDRDVQKGTFLKVNTKKKFFSFLLSISMYFQNWNKNRQSSIGAMN